MRGFSKTIIAGHLGGDPESHTFDDGNSVCNFSVATSEVWNDKKSGEKQERTEWHRVVATGKIAEICQQYLHKGSAVLVEGQNKTRSWEKDGAKVYTTEIVVGFNGTVQFLGGRDDNADSPAPASKPAQAAAPAVDDLDDDIPF